MASADLRDELNCSICLEVYADPVTLRCGHNFCRVCIDRVLDKQTSQDCFSCPQCRSTFKKRPWLQRNVTLANIAERFQSAPPLQEKTKVYCTYCFQAPVEAVKSCLHCEASLCDSHLNVHSKSLEHVLIEPTTHLEKKNCSVHKKNLEYYCTVNSTCLCALCLQDTKHFGHPHCGLHEAFKNKKDELKHIQAQLTSMRQETQGRLQGLQESKKKADEAADGLIERVGTLFQNIHKTLDDLHIQTIENITKQAEKNAQQVSDLIQQLNIKMEEISSKICHIEELCHGTDPFTVLQEQESKRHDFCAPEMRSHEADPSVVELDEISISLTLRENLSEIWDTVSKALNFPEMSELRFDKTTAASNVAISADFVIALGTHENLDIYDTCNRFESYQVLSRTGLYKGRHYWEVELSDTNNWRVGMSYWSIDRDGHDSIFGNTFESWCLCKSQEGYSFRHDNMLLPIWTAPSFRFRRLGIYVDYDKGVLSFYHLGSQILRLYTYNGIFTEPLHAAFRVAYGVWVKILN